MSIQSQLRASHILTALRNCKTRQYLNFIVARIKDFREEYNDHVQHAILVHEAVAKSLEITLRESDEAAYRSNKSVELAKQGLLHSHN